MENYLTKFIFILEILKNLTLLIGIQGVSTFYYPNENMITEPIKVGGVGSGGSRQQSFKV